MFPYPYASSPGQFLGDRPTAQVPDAPLSDDDRAGIRALYPDPNDAINVGAIRGRIMPANPFALATFAATSTGKFMTGMMGAHVVAVDADTGSVIAGTLGDWTCDVSNPSAQFDGSYDIERPPVGHNYPSRLTAWSRPAISAWRSVTFALRAALPRARCPA
jgi:hypothetical protein